MEFSYSEILHRPSKWNRLDWIRGEYKVLGKMCGLWIRVPKLKRYEWERNNLNALNEGLGYLSLSTYWKRVVWSKKMAKCRAGMRKDKEHGYSVAQRAKRFLISQFMCRRGWARVQLCFCRTKGCELLQKWMSTIQPAFAWRRQALTKLVAVFVGMKGKLQCDYWIVVWSQRGIV